MPHCDTWGFVARIANAMDSHLLEIIKDTTEFIERNLSKELSLDSISDNVHVSKFHLLRIWKGATSIGLMEYVRRRRVALSLGDLLCRRNSIEFIASKYSFGCERSYIRAFKDEFNTTPAKWRRNPYPLQILDRFNADFINRTEEGLVFLRSISVLPAFTIAGYEYVIDTAENDRQLTASQHGADFFYNHRPKVINPVDKYVYIGFTTVPGQPAGFTLYQPSVQINESSIVPRDMKVRHVQPHKYGVFKYMGPHRPEEISAKTLASVWEHIFEVWMPTVQFDLEEVFSFERIDYSKCSRHYCECDLYYPISRV